MEAPKDIVMCFDGTGDWIAADRTNVAKIFSVLDREKRICYYDGGIGTLTDPRALGPVRRTALRFLDLAVATSLREKVLQAYLFLVRNYRTEGELRPRIYFFGFSRGAYTARVLAGMIHNFGLLRPECEHLAPYLWQIYSGFKKVEDLTEDAEVIRREFGGKEKVEIAFMGLFDTVSSVGVIGRFKTHPNTDENPSVRRTCHAVSIDEQRNVFPESLMHPQQPGLTEVWFPGVHRDVGGGLEPARSRIADEALEWMEGEAIEAGLPLLSRHEPDRTCTPRPNYPPSDPYVLFGLYPMNIFSKRVSAYRLVWPNFWNIRTMPSEALVHPIARTLFEDERERRTHPNLHEKIVWFGPASASHRQQAGQAYGVERVHLSPSEFATTTVGTAGLFLLWNALLLSPLGDSWPFPAWTAWGLVFALLGLEFLGHRRWTVFGARLGLHQERLLPLVALGLAALAVILVPGWKLLWAGLLGGAALFAAGQAPGLPVMRANRLLPTLVVFGLGSVMIMRCADWGIGRWIAGSTSVWAGFRQGIALPLAVVGLSLAIVFALRDRFRMRDDQAEKRFESAPLVGDSAGP